MILSLIILPFFVLHYLRWLALVQQKEYRLDRLMVFLRSQEGREEFFLPFPFSFIKKPTLAEIKRPTWTLRLLIVFSFSLIILEPLVIFSYPFAKEYVWLILYLFLPLIIFISTLPTILAAEIITNVMLFAALRTLEKSKPLIIGITGSYGKSSTKLLLAHLLSQKESVFTTPLSHNTRFSVSLSILKSYRGEKIAVLEYAAYTKDEIKKLAHWFKPDISLITGIALQHAGLFGSLNNIINAKAELLKVLPLKGKSFCNPDDINAIKLCTDFAAQKTVPILPNLISKPQLNTSGKLSFTYHGRSMHTQLIGKHYLPNVKLAVAVSQYLGLSPAQIAKGLVSFKPNNIFTNSRILKHGILLIDDGRSSNPTGFKAIINLASQIKKKNKILLTSGIVDLGKQASPVHHQLAKAVDPVFDTVLYMGSEGREEFAKIFTDRLTTDKEVIKQKLGHLEADSLLAIEGKIRKDFLKVIK